MIDVTDIATPPSAPGPPAVHIAVLLTRKPDVPASMPIDPVPAPAYHAPAINSTAPSIDNSEDTTQTHQTGGTGQGRKN
ncbi:hypothetical protein DXG01_003986 [Tephrocybe rancida]|nr:hypothetical protein DXG01_003986 [Tephrocybe rancida]